MGDQAGLADPRVAAEEHDCSLVAGAGPGRVDHRLLVVAAHERTGTADRCVGPPRDSTLADHPEQLHRPGHPLEGWRTVLLDVDEGPGELQRGLADEDLPGWGLVLDACGHVRCLADEVVGLDPVAATHVGDHRQTGVDADTDGQPTAGRSASGLQAEGIDRSHHCQPGQGCAGRIVLVCGGEAEVRQDAVADETGHGPAERFDGCRTGGLERSQDLPSVLRVESPRQLGRADDVAEQDGEASPGSQVLGR